MKALRVFCGGVDVTKVSTVLSQSFSHWGNVRSYTKKGLYCVEILHPENMTVNHERWCGGIGRVVSALLEQNISCGIEGVVNKDVKFTANLHNYELPDE